MSLLFYETRGKRGAYLAAYIFYLFAQTEEELALAFVHDNAHRLELVERRAAENHHIAVKQRRLWLKEPDLRLGEPVVRIAIVIDRICLAEVFEHALFKRLRIKFRDLFHRLDKEIVAVRGHVGVRVNAEIRQREAQYNSVSAEYY